MDILAVVFRREGDGEAEQMVRVIDDREIPISAPVGHGIPVRAHEVIATFRRLQGRAADAIAPAQRNRLGVTARLFGMPVQPYGVQHIFGRAP